MPEKLSKYGALCDIPRCYSAVEMPKFFDRDYKFV